MKKAILFIPEPCDKNWLDMAPTGRADCRFCDRCERQIRDFTFSTDAEIAEQFRLGGGKICGRFRADQLDRPIRLEARPSVFGRAAGLVFGGALAASGAEAQSVKPQEVFVNQPVVIGNTVIVAQKEAGQKRRISGKIVEAETGEALIGALVYSVKFPKIGTHTDVDGKFSLELPDDAFINRETLITSYTGYLPQSFSIPKTPDNHEVSVLVKMEFNPGLIGEVVIKKAPFRNRVRRFFKRIF